MATVTWEGDDEEDVSADVTPDETLAGEEAWDEIRSRLERDAEQAQSVLAAAGAALRGSDR